MKLLLIDGHSLAYRAFYALPALTSSAGVPTQALLGVVNMTLKILEDEKPTHMIVFFDREVPAFRKEAYAEYKATRKPPPDDFLIQLPHIEEFYALLGVPVIAETGYEADDWIAAAVRKAEPGADEILILSADLDLLQLVSGKTTLLASQRGTSKFTRYTVDEIARRFGVSPSQWVDMKAIVGDTSDNIKGVPGVGWKTAADLLREHGTLENLLRVADRLSSKLGEKMLAHKDQALLNKDLVTLRSDAPLDSDPDRCSLPPFNEERLREFFERFEFKRLADRFDSSAGAAAGEEAEFQPVESGEELARMLEAFGGAKRAGFLVWPVPSPFVERHFLAVDLGEAGRFVVFPSRFAEAVRGIGAFADPREIFSHNWKALNLALLENGIPSPPWTVCDTQIAGWLCDSAKTNPSLPELVREHLQISLPEKAPDASGEMAAFLARWVAPIERLGEKLKARLRELSLESLYGEMEYPLVEVLSEMERSGVALDPACLTAVSHELLAALAALEGEIYTEAGVIFNLNSSKQLADILYHKLQLPRGRRTKTGYSTDIEELERLSEFSTLPAKLLQYRELAKLQNTYVDALPRLLNPRTGRLHTTYAQTGTSTGRLSSKEPNLQNIPIRAGYGKKIRRAFVAGKPGWRILSADYSQIELRLLAHCSRDPVLTRAFLDKEDIHSRTASEVFGVPADSVTPEMRRMAKTVNFGIIYGMTEHGLSQSLGMKKEDAREYIRKYLDRFPKVEVYIRNSLEEARETGVTRTLSGRLRFVPDLRSSNRKLREQAERMAVNAPLQGSAADLIKLAMIGVRKRLAGKKGAFMIMQVHDELVLEVPAEEEKEVSILVKEEMENAAKLEVPLVADIASGENWAEMESLDVLEKKR